MGEGEGGMIWENSIKAYILSSVKQIASPGWMHETGAQGWCTGMTQSDGMGREVGRGFRMRNTLNPWLIHVNVWQKPLQYCKVISLQLVKIKKKLKMKMLIKEIKCAYSRIISWYKFVHCVRIMGLCLFQIFFLIIHISYVFYNKNAYFYNKILTFNWKQYS